jgi:hypothetical protein
MRLLVDVGLMLKHLKLKKTVKNSLLKISDASNKIIESGFRMTQFQQFRKVINAAN